MATRCSPTCSDKAITASAATAERTVLESAPSSTPSMNSMTIASYPFAAPVGSTSEDFVPAETKLSTTQLADRDWQWLMTVVFGLIFTYAGGLLMYILLQAFATVADLFSQLILTLLLFEQNSGVILGAAFSFGIVFGGHCFLRAPACLRPPTAHTQPQVAGDSTDKEDPSTPSTNTIVATEETPHLDLITVLTNTTTDGRQKSFNSPTSHSSVECSSSGISSSGSHLFTANDYQVRVDTPCSSEDGGIGIKDFTSNKQCSSHVGSHYHGSEKGANPASRLKKRHLVDLAHLFDLIRIHGNPTFHEGPLYEVALSALDHQRKEARSIYTPGDTASDFTGVASCPNRSISADKKDVKCILDEVRARLPLDLQAYLDKFGNSAIDRSRDGMTGLNIWSDRPELLWHERRPPVINGISIPVTDLSVVRNFQKYRARHFRPAWTPEMQPRSAYTLTYRQYLSDEQVIKINQGCADYSKYNEHGYKCDSLQQLECHADHAGAKIDNPVLGWLDEMECVDFDDPNGYLPCPCGTRALNDHVNSRNEIEPGYNMSLSAQAVPRLSCLGYEALTQDFKRKADEQAHFVQANQYPRSQEIAQECSLHAVPTNNLWILLDGVEDANTALTGHNNDLPVPGFTELTAYPPGFRISQGFCAIEQHLLPPRCQHGYLHPPFADHCMGCFPSGAHDEGCVECEAHGAICAIVQDSRNEHEYDASRAGHDKSQWSLVRKADRHERNWVSHARRTAGDTSEYFDGWARAVVV